MSFTSITFLIFIIAVFVIYWMTNGAGRTYSLFLASCIFLLWNANGIISICTLASVAVISWLGGRLLSRRVRGSRLMLAITIAVTAAPLFCVKANMFPAGHIPLGISFYTFQAISYLVDIYCRKIKQEDDPVIYALFLSFFPYVQSGPISRAGSIIPQLRDQKKVFHYDKAVAGLRQILWGMFLKMALADTLAVNVNEIYSNITGYTGFSLVLLTFMFTFEIYCDFAGYSYMARGIAALLGIDIAENFKRPYLSSSVKEFWSRWHISLSTWLRDYIYIPLGGSRCSRTRSYFNLMMTFLFSGLWHGTSWTFLLWGGIHGLAQIIEKECQYRFSINKEKRGLVQKDGNRKQLHTLVKTILVFLFCNFAWIFFRANRIQDVFWITGHMFDGMWKPVRYIKDGMEAFTDKGNLMIMLFILAAVEISVEKYSLKAFLERLPRAVRCGIYIIMILLIWYMIPVGRDQQFLYFSF